MIRSKRMAVGLYGTVPPRRGTSEKSKLGQLTMLQRMHSTLDPTALMIYDVQDEEGRTDIERPFEYKPMIPSEEFAMQLRQDIPAQELVVYKVIGSVPKTEFDEWLSTVAESGILNLVFVGAGSSDEVVDGYTVIEAYTRARDSGLGFMLGGILIPERHVSSKRNPGREHHRMALKAESGVEFFTTQVTYSADGAISVLRDYDRLCKKKGVKPARVLFTFAPFGSEETLLFLKWLGVEVPESTSFRVLSAGQDASEKQQQLKDCVKESVRVCREIFKRILDAVLVYRMSVRVGFTIESVSRKRVEINAADDLYIVLKDELNVFYTPHL